MNKNKNVVIKRLETGVAGLDNLLGGGMPEFSFNIIAGSPGSGKTTLAHQIMFAHASEKHPAIYFTVLGEPSLKMLRYQQQFSFFDSKKIGKSIFHINLSEEIVGGDFDRVLERIVEEVEKHKPSMVFVDSFRSIIEAATNVGHMPSKLQNFVQQLAMRMTSWQATTFLIGEYQLPEKDSSPVFTVADGIIWVSQQVHRDAMVRKIQIVKMRGQAQSAGLHTLRIGNDGVEIFPRTILPPGAWGQEANIHFPGDKRLSMGVPALDKMMGGGLPVAYSLLLVGPSGSGKSIIATQFLAEGVRMGEPGVIAAFEKSPNQLLSQQLNKLVKSGKVGLIDTRSLDLSIDETLHNLVAMIKSMQAKRVVIDSLSGFELALAPVFREDFRESLYRMVAVLTSMGVTVLMTAELEDRYTELRFSSYGNAFLADSIVLLRYVEIAGEFKRVISVVKVRASEHSKDIRFFTIGHDCVIVDERSIGYQSILTGQPVNFGVTTQWS
ncbi:MAG: AAA family ATPase [Methylotenera sp.]|nr:AAA family ATPase [Methylotenera sp.]